MRIIEERTTGLSLKHPVVGCGIQNEQCLALQVSGSEGSWTISWGLAGEIGEPEFKQKLSASTGKMPFWTSLTEEGALQTAAVAWIDLPRTGDRDVETKDKIAALRTQTLNRFASADEVVLRGVEVRKEASDPAHLVGGVALKRRVEEDYANWKRIMNIRYPHIASNSIALANAFLALYCRQAPGGDAPCRIVFLEGRAITRVIVMDGWRLVEALEFRMMENMVLDELMIRHWTDTVLSRIALERSPEPLVVPRPGVRSIGSFEIWDPFSSSDVQVGAAAKALLGRNLDLATITFGMALQGGV